MKYKFNMDFFVCFRRNYNPGVFGGARNGLFGAGVCSICPEGSTVFPNPTDGPNGSQRRHVETFGLGCIRTQTGE